MTSMNIDAAAAAIVTQVIANGYIIYLVFNKKNCLYYDMNNNDLKLSIFLAIGITLSITLLLTDFENNNNILMAQEEGKSINSINNNNLQSNPTFNSNPENFKKSITVKEAVNDIRTTTTINNDHTSELTIQIPKGSFHPATHRSFNPDEIIINKGEKLTWINEDKTPHTITSKDKLLFDSLLEQNEEFTYQFDKVGTFELGCTLHPWMHETINVI
ncbi:MAG TPA: cupredoxin domain-containing protein [Nitrososphaeraceae archaeon]|nr:cupredoxin domain-containing protein [Nitrososphaeraceae archaeon]